MGQIPRELLELLEQVRQQQQDQEDERDSVIIGELNEEEKAKYGELDKIIEQGHRLSEKLEILENKLKATHREMWHMVQDRYNVPSGVLMSLNPRTQQILMKRELAEAHGVPYKEHEQHPEYEEAENGSSFRDLFR